MLNYIVFVLAIIQLADAFTIGSNSERLRPSKRGFKPRAGASSFNSVLYRNRQFTSLNDKWDDLDDEKEEFVYKGPPIPKDMRYIEFNVVRQNHNFSAIRQAGGPDMTNDVYVRAPGCDTFWFVGKVARISDISIEKAVARQYGLIEEHASRLRPLELYPESGSLEIWVAPGDSEMDVAYNRPSVRFIKMGRADAVEGTDSVRNVEVGFQGELYEGGEEGFRTLRNEDGLPKQPEIQPGGETRIPTDEEKTQFDDFMKDNA